MIACILCSQEKANHIRLCSKTGVKMKCRSIIIKHFSWLKSEAEKNKKQRICFVCWRILRGFHEFYRSVAKTYNYLEDNLKTNFSDNHPIIAASEESFVDPLPTPLEAEISTRGENVVTVDVKLEIAAEFENVSAPLQDIQVDEVPLLLPEMEEVAESNDIEVDEVPFILPKIEDVAAPMDIKINEAPYMLPLEDENLNKDDSLISSRALRATRRSQRKVQQPEVVIKYAVFKKETNDEKPPSKPKKCGRPARSIETTVEEIQQAQKNIKTESTSPQDYETTYDDRDESEEESAPSVAEKDVCDSDALSDIEYPERRAEIAPRSPPKTKKKRIRLRPCSSYRRMTDKEKEMKQLEQEKYDEIIAKFFDSFPCPKCRYLVCTFGEMRKHFNAKHSGSIPSVVCCGRRFPQRKMLADHVLFHLNPEHFKCAECKKCFHDSSTLKIHEETHRNPMPKEKQTFECEICSQVFTLKKSLEEHHARKHTPESEFKFACNECDKKFALKRLLTNHQLAVHRGGVVICEQCGRSDLKSKSALRHHIRIEHSNAPPVKPARVECPICKTTLCSEGSLKEHIISIHQETQEVGKYRCHICGYLSVNARALKRHIYYNHEAERKFKCTMCEKAFKKKEGLKEHITMHTGVGRHTCPECQMTFACKANFHKHKQRRHGFMPVRRNLIGMAEKKRQKLKAAADDQAAVSLCYNFDEQNKQNMETSM